jgi:proline iminopeptidase
MNFQLKAASLIYSVIIFLSLVTCFFSKADLYADKQVISKVFEGQAYYPQSEPFHEGFLQVSDGHTLYYAEFGNPDGVPVVTLHGGPGSQCYSSWTAFFDPEYYRIIMFDQRGAGRSTPFASMQSNTPQHTLEDIEQLRKHLDIEKWVLFGGSCGSFLAILYGEEYPQNCLGFVLRGIFLGREHDYTHLFYGMRNTHPEAWDTMVQTIPENERGDLIGAFHKRVMDPDPEVHLTAARAFMRFDLLCATLLPNSKKIDEVDTNYRSTLGIGRAYIHYSANGFFVRENQLLEELHKISHLPAILIQGRYDVICPPAGAFDLYQQWENCELWYVSDAGHAISEPGISQSLRQALDQMKGILKETSPK